MMGIPPNPRSPPKDENLNQPPTIGRIGRIDSWEVQPDPIHRLLMKSMNRVFISWDLYLKSLPFLFFFERLPAALRPRVPQQLNSFPGFGLEVPFKIMQILLSTQLQKLRTLFSLSYFREFFQFLKNTQSISEQDS